jgi:hypothetical protein
VIILFTSSLRARCPPSLGTGLLLSLLFLRFRVSGLGSPLQSANTRPRPSLHSRSSPSPAADHLAPAPPTSTRSACEVALQSAFPAGALGRRARAHPLALLCRLQLRLVLSTIEQQAVHNDGVFTCHAHAMRPSHSSPGNGKREAVPDGGRQRRGPSGNWETGKRLDGWSPGPRQARWMLRDWTEDAALSSRPAMPNLATPNAAKGRRPSRSRRDASLSVLGHTHAGDGLIKSCEAVGGVAGSLAAEQSRDDHRVARDTSHHQSC